MAERFRLGFRNGVAGMWVSRPGFDVATADSTSRAQFLFSTDFVGRPLRLIMSGLIGSTQNINLPGSLASLGGEPLLNYKRMIDPNKEGFNGFISVDDGAGGYENGVLYESRFNDGNPAQFRIYERRNYSNTSLIFRYSIFLF